MKKSKRFISLFLAAVAVTLLLAACGGGGLPNGRYEPTDSAQTAFIPAIVVDGNKFSVLMPMEMGANDFTYEFSDGTFTLTDANGMSASIPCTYKDGILSYGGVEFKKVS
ncbi:MAG: hypothetical protein LBS21_15300 [Clostridiales bacterium]|jgi:hypothetical protein|nr:hypothetical protein [Clostridiales bacterium]